MQGGSTQSPSGDKVGPVQEDEHHWIANSWQKRNYDEESLRPVTIKILRDATNDGQDTFKHDGRPLTQIKFIGQVQNLNKQTTYINFSIDDGTGVCDVKRYLDSETQQEIAESGGMAKLPQVGQYAKVIGTMKEFNNKRYVSSVFVRPVTDPNEIAHHFLETTLVHLQFTRGTPTKAGVEHNMSGMGGMGGDMGYANNTGAMQMPAMSANAQKVYNYLQQAEQGNEGCNAQQIAADLRMDIAKCQLAGQELIGKGLAFTTLDDDTWAIMTGYD